MELFDLLEDELVELGRNPKIFRPRQYLEDDMEFKQRFRLSIGIFNELKDRLSETLLHPTLRNKCLSPQEQILTTLRFYATNSFYHVIRDSHDPHESTACRTVKAVTTAINDRYIISRNCQMAK